MVEQGLERKSERENERDVKRVMYADRVMNDGDTSTHNGNGTDRIEATAGQ